MSICGDGDAQIKLDYYRAPVVLIYTNAISLDFTTSSTKPVVLITNSIADQLTVQIRKVLLELRVSPEKCCGLSNPMTSRVQLKTDR
jgi:hypothetical protein